jgi:outer membrane protein assembly factor BamA
MRSNIKLIRLLCLVSFFQMSFFSGLSQSIFEFTSKKNPKEKILLQPIIFSSPETGLAVGSLLFYQKETAFNYRNTITGIVNYSFNKQYRIILRPNFFLAKGNLYLKGHLEFNKRQFQFWGIGDTTPQDNNEDIDGRDLKLNIDFYKKIKRNIYIGPSYSFYSLSDTALETDSLLDETFPTLGFGGYQLSGAGLSFLMDNRNSFNSPSSGTYIELKSTHFLEQLGSDFDFNTYHIDLRKYYKLTSEKDHILALRSLNTFTSSEAPWNHKSQLGGLAFRGYFEGRFRDQNLSSIQAEYRSPLLIGRFGIVGFAGYAWVYDSLDEFINNKKYGNIGTGIRFSLDKEDKLNLRFDFALGELGNRGVYFGIREVF